MQATQHDANGCWHTVARRTVLVFVGVLRDCLGLSVLVLVYYVAVQFKVVSMLLLLVLLLLCVA